MLRGVKRYKVMVLLALWAAVSCCSCSMVRTLDSESGLYDVKLQRNKKALVDGGWTWGGGNPYENRKKGAIYFAPLDISKVEKEHPDLAALMVPQMHDYVVQEVSRALRESNEANGTNWSIAEKPEEALMRVDMAVVHFRPQRPGLRVLSGIGGHFIKVPGVSDVVGRFAKGDICIEMTIRDVKTGQLYLACKDSNGRTASLISTDAYKRSGNANASLKYWAERLAFVIRSCAADKLEGRTLQDVINDRSWGEVLKDRVMN